MSKSVFKFKHFTITQADNLHKIGTDAMVLGAMVNKSAPKTILDVGTGCGVIALMLAQKFPKADIVGIDIDENAVLQTQENFRHAPFQNDLRTAKVDFLNYQPENKFDLIVSNPPYFNSKMPSQLKHRDQARHESSMTVVQLIRHATQLLEKNGALWLILPKERTDELFAIKNQLTLSFYRIPIYGKPNKHVRDVLVFTLKMNREDLLESLVIRTEKGDYSQQYKELTKSFHYNKI